MGRMDSLMQMAAICEAYGWTFEEYHSQPAYFIDLIKRKMDMDNKRRSLETKSLRNE